MKTKELMIIVFLVLFMIHLASCASSSTPLKGRPFLLDDHHELQKKNIVNKDEAYYSYKHGTIASRSNLDVTVFRGGGSGGRGGGGGRGGSGGGRRGGGGDRGGMTVIPVYTAGTHHSNNNNQKGSGNSNQMDLNLNLFLIILASTTTFASIFFYY
ncbi:glycine-rich cell wall structural protein-like [Impatiens glandulifera]|uniref:glycine-rich cell wall structural protein-like n=1 Tax=Impatiens glandulifera TaxID=253017 RepID=UPI001FB09302|nr:glycine-rich cell wall structural protein-like [Impatiens glandulifera]